MGEGSYRCVESDEQDADLANLNVLAAQVQLFQICRYVGATVRQRSAHPHSRILRYCIMRAESGAGLVRESPEVCRQGTPTALRQ